MNEQDKVKQAVQILIGSLLENESYRKTWEAHIAMSFKDEYARVMGDSFGVQLIADTAAKNFLTQLTSSK